MDLPSPNFGTSFDFFDLQAAADVFSKKIQYFNDRSRAYYSFYFPDEDPSSCVRNAKLAPASKSQDHSELIDS